MISIPTTTRLNTSLTNVLNNLLDYFKQCLGFHQRIDLLIDQSETTWPVSSETSLQLPSGLSPTETKVQGQPDEMPVTGPMWHCSHSTYPRLTACKHSQKPKLRKSVQQKNAFKHFFATSVVTWHIEIFSSEACCWNNACIINAKYMRYLTILQGRLQDQS